MLVRSHGNSQQNGELHPSNSSVSVRSVTFRAGSPDIFTYSQQDGEGSNNEGEPNQLEKDVSNNHSINLNAIKTNTATISENINRQSNVLVNDIVFTNKNEYLSTVAAQENSTFDDNNVYQNTLKYRVQVSENIHSFSDSDKQSFNNKECSAISCSPSVNNVCSSASLQSTCLSPIPSLRDPYTYTRGIEKITTESITQFATVIAVSNDSEDMFDETHPQIGHKRNNVSANNLKDDVLISGKSYCNNSEWSCLERKRECRILSSSMLAVENGCYLLLTDLQGIHLYQCSDVTTHAKSWSEVVSQPYDWSLLDLER